MGIDFIIASVNKDPLIILVKMSTFLNLNNM